MDVSEVHDICRELTSEKANDRKKAVNNLKTILNRSSIKKALDRNFSEERSTKRNFSWDNVFRAACTFAAMEVEELKNANTSVSKATLTTREKRKHEASGLVKIVVRLADKGGPKLRAATLFKHILESLKDGYMCEAFGQDYCSIMLKNVLTQRKYMVELNAQSDEKRALPSWHEMLSMFFKLFNNKDAKGIDNLVLARIINSIIHGLTVQCDVRPKKILAFFSEYFSKAKEHKSPAVLEYMLRALNTLIRTIAPHSRVQICKLGEDITVSMLYLWKNVASDPLKDCLTEFLQLQLWAHHPNGEKQGSAGAFAVDWDKWMSCLRSLYELLYREIHQIAGKSKSKDCVLKPAFIDLAVDVCNQLFTENSQTIDITQQSLLVTDTQAGPSSKKRRLDSGWEAVRGVITAAGQTSKLIPWVQLVTRLVNKYTESLPAEEVLPYLTSLSHILADCKRADLMVHILRCLQAFSSSWDKLVSMATDLSSQTQSIWNQVWSVTLRYVSLHHAEAEGYIVLSCMLEKQLVISGREIWSMFIPSVSLPMEHSVRFLATCVQLCDFPENYVPKLIVTLQPIGEDSKFPLRKQLIDWLLPNREDETDWPKAAYNIDADWTAHTLVTLILRDPSALAKGCERRTRELNDLERIYLETALLRPLAVERINTDDTPCEAMCDVVHVQVLLRLVEDKILRDVQYFCGRGELQITDIEDMVRYTEMMARVLGFLLKYHIVTVETISSIGLLTQLSALMQKVSTSLVDMVKKEGHGKVLPVLSVLQRLYSIGWSDTSMSIMAGSVCRAVTPARLIDLLWDIVSEKTLSRSRSADSDTNQSRYARPVSYGKRARLADDFEDELDMEFEDQSNNNNHQDDDIDEDDGMESQEGEETGSTEACFKQPSVFNTGNKLWRKGLNSRLTDRVLEQFAVALLRIGQKYASLLGNLPESQLVKLESTRLLCVWCCQYDRGIPLRSEVDVLYTRSKVIGLLNDATFDPVRILDIQQLRIIVMQLTDREQILSDNDLKMIIAAVRKVSKLHFKDHEVCCLCLKLLQALVPSLAVTDNGDMSECRESAIHLLQAFINRQDKGYPESVRLGLLQIVEQFIICDPKGDWTMLMNQENADDAQVSPGKMFVDYAADLSYTVRMHVASALYKLFVRKRDKSWVCFEQNIQESYLTLMHDNLSESLDLQGKMSAERLEDERSCSMASVLTALASVICVSPMYEKKVLFTVIKMTRESNIKKDMTNRMLNKVADVLQFPSLKSFMESHLPFLLHHWLLHGFPIEEFPYFLLSCDQREEFYRKCISTIVPELIITRNMDAVETVASEIQVDKTELVSDCVPRIVVHILPLFAASGMGEAQDSAGVMKRTKRARACYDLLIAQLSQEVVDRQIVNNLEEVVVNILMCLYDTDQDSGEICNSNPEPNPPSYNSYVVTSTLDYITKSFSGGGKTLVEILSKTPDSIQKILLELITSLFTSHRLAERRRVLMAYQLFVRLLLKQFNSQLGGSWAYVLREVIVRLVYLVKDMTAPCPLGSQESPYREAIASMALQLVREVCVVAVECCPQEMMKYLPLLTSHFVSTVQLEGDVKEQSLSLLKFLVLEKAKILRPAIAALDNFPDKPVFKEFCDMHRKLKYAGGPFSLGREIEHFLNTGLEHSVETELRLEGLKFLKEQLTDNRMEVSTLVNGSLMCRLIQELLQMTGCKNKAVQLEACKCLGVIGPVNLNTISLPDRQTKLGLQRALECFQNISSEWQTVWILMRRRVMLRLIWIQTVCNSNHKVASRVQKELPEALKYCRIFHCLNDFLMGRSVQLVQRTSDVLKTLLSVRTGIDFSARYRKELADNEFLFNYLHPFRCNKKKAVKLKLPSASWDNFASSVDRESLWNPDHSNHSNWIITLTTTLITSGAVADEILKLLEPVCAIKADFCELVLPYLVHDILQSGDDRHKEVLSRQLNNFFSCHCGQTASRISRCQSTASVASLDGDYVCMNVNSVRVMLSVVQYLRQQPRTAQGRVAITPWDNNFWLDVDYLQVAMAAQYCSAHFSTLLYAEIWCDVQREKTDTRGSQSQRSLSQDTRIDTLSEASSTQSGVSVQDLLMEAYKWIGDPDGVYGCGAGRKADTSSRLCTYEHENQWDKAVISCDIQMDQSQAYSRYDVLHALQNFGASHIFETYLQSTVAREDIPDLTSDIKELQYESSWKMAQWNIDTPNKLTETMGFHECLYKGLKAMIDEDLSFTEASLNKARMCTITGVGDGCLDTVGRLYPILADLQCVNVLDTVQGLLNRKGKSTLGLKLQLSVEPENDFEFQAPALHMSCTALNTMYAKTGNQEVFKEYVNRLQNLSRCARVAGRHQISERAVHKLKSLAMNDLGMELESHIEEARLYWSRAEFNIAKHLVRTMIDRLKKLKHEDQVAAKFYPRMLSIYGNWLAETRSENPNIIMEEYLEKTVVLFEQSSDTTETCVDAYLSLARYADTQYQNIVNYMKSSTFEAKNSLMEKSKAELERLKQMPKDKELALYLRTLDKQSRIDTQELKTKQEDRERFLKHAVEGYIKCLKLGDSHNLRVFRLASLWFSNTKNDIVNQYMEEAVKEIKTYKWLPLMYQLAARMDTKSHGDNNELFLKTLNQLIYQAAVTHPYHTLSCVLTLANANRDKELEEQAKAIKRTAKANKTSSQTVVAEGRILAAKEMIKKLREANKVGDMVKEMQGMCDAYIQLANWDVSKFKSETKPIQLPSALWISQIKDLRNTPVLTRDIKVNPSGCYDNISYIRKFQPTFKLAGGINLPKIITCLGSDGTSSRQLVKGRDDLRQDAVMQQVFEMVNNLLMKDGEARKRTLHIRKYKVIPLSQRSGLLEWCEGTQPIGEYLIGSASSTVKGAHQRYRPKDWMFNQCRKQLSDAAGNAEAQYKAYREVCNKFQPVFRHFFLEKFSLPSVWFECRLAYTRSVATNSIVGYILGLGDRHVQNILIDCNTAELVHIDLGVAFEQGRILTVPETVPFRLTRDIEDAMGSCGVEGVFRRCCERTMEVMRTNQEAVLTILEVLLYDPLHVWTISPLKAYELQQRRDRGNDTIDMTTDGDDLDDSASSRTSCSSYTGQSQENVNKLAERVLLRLQQKLQGLEDGIQLSLTGQVNHLIQEARNPKNLARLFPGWQPYL